MKIKNNILQKIKNYAITNYQKLNVDDFEIGEAPFNYKCHMNAVQKVKENKAEKVYLCFTIEDDGFSCVHFINKLQNGKWQDNTWGWMYTHYDYYIIREINENEYDTIWNILTSAKKSLIEICSSKLERYIFKINGNDLYELI